ncbi:Hs1pro-1 protein C-terminus [Musa troglodytarum]|uniref:Hs1pro-1 protein C-terminus n=1 Tax=Musa troglodytarum TaxID=320322 RepID=A0A9E7G0L9_9LILI|nr:Hs1pro-1 protein C-terminus [Musa troglodytarum]
MAASEISPAPSDAKSYPSTTAAALRGHDASAIAAYEHYLRLPELAKLWSSNDFPRWANESILKPALQGLEITFRFVSLALSDPRPYANHREWKRRLESVAARQVELIATLCEEEARAGGGAPIADLSSCQGLLSRDKSSQEVWKVPGTTSVVNRTSEASLLPRLATWEKSEDVASKILFQIESQMHRCPFTLGLGEPNLAGKPTLEYDLVVRPSDLHALKRSPGASKDLHNHEDQALCTIQQILESWLFAARELLARVEQRMDDKDWAQAANDCWLLERVWKLLSEVEDLHLLMDPDDFLRLKSQLAIKATSGSEAFCFRSAALLQVTNSCKDLKRRVPWILGVEADPNGGPRVQDAAMRLFHSRRRGEGDNPGKIDLLQALQAVEVALKTFFFAYRHLVATVVGSLEASGNRAVYTPSEALDPLSQVFLEPPYYPSLDAAKTFLGDFWHNELGSGASKTKSQH